MSHTLTIERCGWTYSDVLLKVTAAKCVVWHVSALQQKRLLAEVVSILVPHMTVALGMELIGCVNVFSLWHSNSTVILAVKASQWSNWKQPNVILDCDRSTHLPQ